MAKKMNGLAVVAVSLFTGTNSKGEQAADGTVILSPLAGTIPSKRVIAAQVAQNMGLFSGASHLVSFTEGEEDAAFGRQFNWANAGKVQPLELIQFIGTLGSPGIVDVMPVVEDTKAGTGGKENTAGKGANDKVGTGK